MSIEGLMEQFQSVEETNISFGQESATSKPATSKKGKKGAKE